MEHQSSVGETRQPVSMIPAAEKFVEQLMHRTRPYPTTFLAPLSHQVRGRSCAGPFSCVPNFGSRTAAESALHTLDHLPNEVLSLFYPCKLPVNL